MPRAPTILTPPPGILPFVPNTTIRSQDANALFNDLYQDGNTPRPIAYGGTGANNAADAITNLGAISQSNFLGAYSIGDGYYSVRDISNVSGTWLRRNGAIYSQTDYPELAALLPPLPDTINWTSVYAASKPVISYAQDGNEVIGIAASGSSDGSEIVRSIDNGLTWNLVFTAPNDRYQKVYKTASGWCIIGSRNVGSVLQFVSVTSVDGVNWSDTVVNTSYRYLPSGGDRSAYTGSALLVVAEQNTSPFDSYYFRSTDGGVTWSSPVSWNYPSFPILASPGRVVQPTSATTAIVSLDNGATFGSPVSANVGTGQIFSWSWNSSNSKFALLKSGPELRTSSDGVLWTTVNTSIPATFIMSSGSAGLVIPNTSTSSIYLSDNLTSFQTRTRPSGTVNGIHSNQTESFLIFLSLGNSVYRGVRTLPTQFQVPDDSPLNGWIKALNE